MGSVSNIALPCILERGEMGGGGGRQQPDLHLGILRAGGGSGDKIY